MNNLVEVAKNVMISCMGAKVGEKIVILTDSLKIGLAMNFSEACRELNFDTILIELNVQKGGEPPEIACRALEMADVCLIITSNSYTHTKARAEANKRGCRIASMPGITEEIVSKTLGIDYDQLEKETNTLRDILTKSKTIRVTTELGTDISFYTNGRSGIADTGKLDKVGAFGNLPAGEAMVAPIEDSGNGKVVIDGVIGFVGIPERPVVLTIVNGEIIRIENDDGKMTRFMDGFEKNIYKIAEFGIGTNKAAEILNNPLVDEKVFSTVHLGLGNNLFMGGNQDCNMHFDVIIKKPTVYCDDVCIIKDGNHIYE